ncbi:MAG TPA: LysM peptidoglycan-binding domain-containing protein [Leptospiraceae bacterium]|nr:LysM peptidoglycan-binding domain-containing protein [Leptospiraceae bacterium]HRG73607.1 LysM peptidoglycan-binding domain-containing protein [Leptospiraceae bacterium]
MVKTNVWPWILGGIGVGIYALIKLNEDENNADPPNKIQKKYFVQKNDSSLRVIAEKLNIPIEGLIEVNSRLQKNPNLIRVGDILILPELTQIEKALRISNPNQRTLLYKSMSVYNPTDREILEFINLKAYGKTELFKELIKVTCLQETGCSHIDPRDGRIQVNHTTVDVGIMQINTTAYAPYKYLEKLADWKYNMSVGISRLFTSYNIAAKHGYTGDDLLLASYVYYQSENIQNFNRKDYKPLLGFQKKLAMYRSPNFKRLK